MEGRVNSLERQVATVSAKVDMIIGEMRDRDNQRAHEISEMRQKHEADMREMNKKHDALNEKLDAKYDALNEKIDSKFDKLSSQIQNLTIAAIVGIGAIVLGGGAIVWSAITTLK